MRIVLQQLEMLKHMRKFHLDDQSVILEKVPACLCLSLKPRIEETSYIISV